MWSKLFWYLTTFEPVQSIHGDSWSTPKDPDIYLIQSKTILGEPNMLMDILAWVRFQTPCVMDQMSYGHFGQDQIFYKGHAQKLCPSFSYPQICPQLQKKKKKVNCKHKQMLQEKEHLSPSQAIRCEMLTWVGARSYVSCWCFYVCSTLQERVTWLHGSK